MAQKKAFFWFAYSLCLFGVFGIHRFYLFEARFKRHWLFLYVIALIAFASGVFGLWDQLLFSYFFALFFQIIDGILIKYHNYLDIESLIFNGMPGKNHECDESTNNLDDSPENNNLPSPISPPESASEQPNVPESQVIKTSDQAQMILKILESKDKRCTLDEIYNKLRKKSDREDSKLMTEKLLHSLFMDNYVGIVEEGENTFFYLLNHSNLSHTDIDNALYLILNRDSDRLAD